MPFTKPVFQSSSQLFGIWQPRQPEPAFWKFRGRARRSAAFLRRGHVLWHPLLQSSLHHTEAARISEHRVESERFDLVALFSANRWSRLAQFSAETRSLAGQPTLLELTVGGGAPIAWSTAGSTTWQETGVSASVLLPAEEQMIIRVWASQDTCFCLGDWGVLCFVVFLKVYRGLLELPFDLKICVVLCAFVRQQRQPRTAWPSGP